VWRTLCIQEEAESIYIFISVSSSHARVKYTINKLYP